MHLVNSATASQLISGFGICLFLALVWLLKWKHRREDMRQARLDKGLRAYMSNDTGRRSQLAGMQKKPVAA